MIPTSKNEVDVYLNASKTNPDEVGVYAAVNFLTSSTSGSSQVPSVTALIDNPIFTMSPGQQKTLPLKIQTSDSPVGNYTIRVTLLAGDPHGCSLNLKPIDLSLYVKPIPDFTLLLDNPSLEILRGAPATKAIVGITTVDGTAAPLRISYSSQWNTIDKSMPSNTTVALTAHEGIVLNPGQSQNATLELAAPFIDDPNLAGPHYTGKFTYTIIATGTWNETATLQRTVVKKLDIPVSIIEKTFAFKITSDKQTIFLHPKEKGSMEIKVEYLGGRHFPVTLQVDGVTLGMNIRLDKNEGVGNYTSIMTIDPINFNFGRRALQIRAEGEGITQLLPFTISQSPFKIVVDPSTISAPLPGQSTTLTVSVIPNQDDYKSKVSLGVQNLPKPDLIGLRLNQTEGLPPFSTILYVSTPIGITGWNSTGIALVATDGQYSENQTISISPQIRVDLEPRLDSLNLDNLPLSKNKLPLIISTNDAKGVHTIFAQPEIETGSGTKFVFTGWNDGVKSNQRVISSSQISSITIVGMYTPQYYLNITSVYGNVKGGGWYNNGTNATIEMKGGTSTSSDVGQEFVGWNGPSAPFLGQPCGDIKTTNTGQKSDGIYLICMNRPHTLIAAWKAIATNPENNNSNNNTIIGIAGGSAIAAIAGAFAYLKFLRPAFQKIPGTEQILQSHQRLDSQQDSHNNQQKSQQRNFPILQWNVYAPNRIRPKGKTFVDVLIENTGEVDVKKVKIDVACPPGIKYDGGTVIIDLLLAHESRKVSFSLIHRDDHQQGPFDVTLALSYEFMTKFVRRNDDKKIILNLRSLRVGIVQSSTINSDQEIEAFGAMKRWLEGRGIETKEINISDLDQLATRMSSFEVDSLIMSVRELSKSAGLADFVRNHVGSKFNVFIYTAGNDGKNADETFKIDEYRRIAKLIGFSPLDIRKIRLHRGFGLKVLNAEHPITRNYHGGDIFRISDQEGDLLTGSVDEGASVLVEQLGSYMQGKEGGLRNIAAILATITESGGMITYFNLPIGANIWVMPDLLERALLFTSKMLE